MGKFFILSAFVILLFNQALAQHDFVLETKAGNVGYSVYLPAHHAANQPLLLVIATERLRSHDSLFTSWAQSRVVACMNSAARGQDSATTSAKLVGVIGEIFNNYHIDRNQVDVYVVSSTSSTSLAALAPETVRSVHFIPSLTSLLQLVNPEPSTTSGTSGQKFSLWKKPSLEADRELHETERRDSLAMKNWHKRSTLEFRLGTLAFLGAAKTASDRQTLMDVTHAHTTVSFRYTKHTCDSIAWFVDFSFLIIPKKQEVSFDDGAISGTGGGGTVNMITWGFKYTFRQSRYRPFVELGVGPATLFIVGGSFSASSFSGVDPGSIGSSLKSAIRQTMQVTFGTGMDIRTSKRIAIGWSLHYIHSGTFDAAGSINSIKAFNTSFSFGYIIGAGKERRAP